MKIGNTEFVSWISIITATYINKIMNKKTIWGIIVVVIIIIAIGWYYFDKKDEAKSISQKLDISQLMNVEVPKSIGLSGIVSNLTNGKFSAKNPDGASVLEVSLNTASTSYSYGDLNGDGKNDVAVTYDWSAGGSGHFTTLAVYVDNNGVAKFVDTATLGDRIKLEGVTIANKTIRIDIITQGPNEGMCCGTLREVRFYNLNNNALNKVNIAYDSNSVINTEAKITVLSPNGGESVKIGDKIVINWKTNKLLSSENRFVVSWGGYLIVNASATTTSYSLPFTISKYWNGTDILHGFRPGQYKFKVSLYDGKIPLYAGKTCSQKVYEGLIMYCSVPDLVGKLITEDQSDNFVTITN